MSVQQIISKLDLIIHFLKPFHTFINSHMVTFITDTLYDKLVPSEIKEDINKSCQDDILEQFWHHGKGEPFVKPTNAFQSLLNLILELSLVNDGICWKICDFKQFLYVKGCEPSKSFYIAEFMTAKKSHEVEVMSSLVAELNHFCECDHVIDIGDGKGYLSSILALEYNLNILGVDASEIKTEGAAKRNRKLLKVWDGCRKKYINEDKNKQAITMDSYKRRTEYINENTQLSDLIREEFPGCQRYSLVGLHTCGDLSPVCLRKFSSDSNLACLVNVSCCYHLLTEGLGQDSGFPMSLYLKEKGFILGRNARMLSLKALPRIASLQMAPNESLLYRAILEKIFIDKLGSVDQSKTQVGRIASKCSNFNEYVRKAFEKLKINVQISDEEIEDYFKTYEVLRPKLWIYFLLMSSFSKVIESIILLDRLLYLKEQGIENSFLIEMFDPVISPRCYGVVAFRDC